jgi:hypothetical protein
LGAQIEKDKNQMNAEEYEAFGRILPEIHTILDK